MTIIPIKSDAHWHELRRKTIGSSEVAALFNHSPYMTRFELWHLKKGNVEDAFTGNKRTRYGQKMEAVIAECVAEETGWQVQTPSGYYTHDTIEGMGCTPDRIIYKSGINEPGALEIKNVDRVQYARDWTDGEPPIHILLQFQHQLACTGWKWGAIAAMVGGNDLKIITLDRHDLTIAKLEQSVSSFWRSIRDDRSPPPFSPDDYDVVRRVYHAADKGGEIDLTRDNELPALCAELSTLTEQRKDAEKREKTLKGQIFVKIGAHVSARCNGFLIRAPEIVKNMPLKEAHVQKYRTLTIKELPA